MSFFLLGTLNKKVIFLWLSFKPRSDFLAVAVFLFQLLDEIELKEILFLF